MSRDEEEASRKSELWRSTFDKTSRSISPQSMRAVEDLATKMQREVITLTRDLGLEVIKLIAELRGMKRQVRVQQIVGAAVAASFLLGAWVMKTVHDEQMESRRRDRVHLTQRIEAARADLSTKSQKAERAAEAAADSAKHAAAESLLAQIEAAEVQARISPPRDREKLRERIAEKKKAAKALGAEL